VTAHAQKPDFVFRRKGRVHLNRQGRQFSRLLAAEVCASAVEMLDTLRSEVVWRVLATHCIRQFPLHFPSRASPCAITFQLESTIQSAPFTVSLSTSSVARGPRECRLRGKATVLWDLIKKTPVLGSTACNTNASPSETIMPQRSTQQ